MNQSACDDTEPEDPNHSERDRLMEQLEVEDVTLNHQAASTRRKRSYFSVKCLVIILVIFVLATLAIFLWLSISGAFNLKQQNSSYQVVCSSEQKMCRSGLECVNAESWCNGKVDCSDYSDEDYCGVCLLPSHSYANCSNGRCIKREWVCDRESDCPMGEDEMGCEKCNGEFEFTCRDYSCIPAAQRCDGYTECEDSSDEFNCLSDADGTVKYRYNGTELDICWRVELNELKSEMCAALGEGGLGDIRITKSNSNLRDEQVYLTRNSSISSALLVEPSQTPCPEVVKSIDCQAECGKSTLDYGGPQALIGGTDAQISELPWQVKVLVGRELCGGSIINKNWILSAAHCLQGADVNAIKLTYGARRFDGSDGTTAGAVKYIIHPNYRANHLQQYFSTYNYDIALIKTGDITFSEKVSPVCLPTPSDIVSSTTPCYISGFGDATRDFRDYIYPEYLQKGKTRAWLSSKCQVFYRNNGVVLTRDWICAGYISDSIDSCAGDSGGPLVCYINSRWVQLGVVSWGMSCMSYLPSIYTRVEHVNDWVQDTVNTP